MKILVRPNTPAHLALTLRPTHRTQRRSISPQKHHQPPARPPALPIPHCPPLSKCLCGWPRASRVRPSPPHPPNSQFPRTLTNPAQALPASAQPPPCSTGASSPPQPPHTASRAHPRCRRPWTPNPKRNPSSTVSRAARSSPRQPSCLRPPPRRSGPSPTSCTSSTKRPSWRSVC